MEGIINLILLLSGACPPASLTLQHHYILFNTPKTWTEAQSHCREKCWDLATIDDLREMGKVLEFSKNKYATALWIGLRKGVKMRWHWSLADKHLYKETEDLFPSIELSHNCGFLKPEAMSVTGCTTKKTSVCFDGKQYFLIENKMMWVEARDYCRSHYKDLASVRNQTELEQIRELDPSHMWVGLFKDPWEWSDGAASSLRYWNAGMRSLSTSNAKACVAMRESDAGKWADLPCGEAHPFLCSCPKQRTFVKVGVSRQDSALDLNDAQVQDGILTRIQQRLMDTGATDVIRLQWRKNHDGSVFIPTRPGSS